MCYILSEYNMRELSGPIWNRAYIDIYRITACNPTVHIVFIYHGISTINPPVILSNRRSVGSMGLETRVYVFSSLL